MEKVIIYPNEHGGIAVIHPCGQNIDIQHIAKIDVPKNVPYLIIDKAELPDDRVFRNAWEADFTTPDGYGVGRPEEG